MESKDIIEKFRQFVIQIATPHSTGTGFYLPQYQLIVTNEHVVRDHKEAVVKSKNFEKQLANIVYVDPKFDLAFLQMEIPVDAKELQFCIVKNLRAGNHVIAVGHPFGLKYTATEGIISNTLHKQDGINYIQHDAALNPGNSGGPLLNSQGEIVGVNTFIIDNGTNIGFSLPANYLKTTLDEFTEHGIQSAVRCNSCLNVVFRKEIENAYCPHCGTGIKMIEDIEVYEPVGINKTIEHMLMQLGYDIDLSRRGPNIWQIKQGSATINVSYHEKTGLLIGDAHLCLLPKKDIKPLYTFLLKENFTLDGLTLSVKGQDIILSLLIYDQYLNVETGVNLFQRLFEAADHYDDVLVNEFGAIWKKEE